MYNDNSKHITIQLDGFNNLKLNSNSIYWCDYENITGFYLDDDLNQMYIFFKSNVDIEKEYKKIHDFLYHICFNLIVHTEVEYNYPKYDIVQIFDKESVKLSDGVQPREEITIVHEIKADEIYKNILSKQTGVQKNFLKYERVFKILQNSNIIVQYMSLYQYLMELLQGENDYISQKSVTEYLKNNQKKYTFLFFEKTRKANANYMEDCFTYMRNEIAHCEKQNNTSLYSKLGRQITQQVIKNIIKVINDVIIEYSN